MSEEESRAVRDGLDEETLVLFDLLKKDALGPAEIKQIKQVAPELLAILKEERLCIDNWREKEFTRPAARVAIRDFL